MTNTLSPYTEANNEDTEPLFADGLDKDGFPGGDQRFNVWPTTIESALNALLSFIPKDQRSEMQNIFWENLEVVDFDTDDEEE